MKTKLVRLDKLIADRKLAESRTLAQYYIEHGRVSVEGQKVTKTACQVPIDSHVTVDAPEKQWVSRGAYKLLKAIDYFAIDPSGKICIDIGASTGGFTDVLLSRGAKTVFAVDVGYGQLAWKLRNDTRVVVMERTNARYLTSDMLGNEKADIIVSDASFISLKLLLKPLENLLKEDGLMVLLVKPQFEVGREHIGKGVVSDPKLHVGVISDLAGFIEKNTRLALFDATFSPIRGPEGNIEFLFLLGFAGDTAMVKKIVNAEDIVEEAHRETTTDEGRLMQNEEK